MRSGGFQAPRDLEVLRIVSIGGLVTLTACSSAAASPSTTQQATPEPAAVHTIAGTFRLIASDGIDFDTGPSGIIRSCRGSGGYNDIKEGAGVVVRDESDRAVETGRLTQEGMTRQQKAPESADYPGIHVVCAFWFSVEGLPAAEPYSVEVTHRGQVTFSREDLAAQNWTVQLSLSN